MSKKNKTPQLSFVPVGAKEIKVEGPGNVEPQQVPATFIEGQVINLLGTLRHATGLEIAALGKGKTKFEVTRIGNLVHILNEATQAELGAMQLHARFEQIIQQQQLMAAHQERVEAEEKAKDIALEEERKKFEEKVGAEATGQLEQLVAEATPSAPEAPAAA
jgi:hypothetical protein